MAKFMKHEVIGRILELGLVPIFYNGDLEVAKKIVQACVDGGAKIVEFIIGETLHIKSSQSWLSGLPQESGSSWQLGASALLAAVTHPLSFFKGKGIQSLFITFVI